MAVDMTVTEEVVSQVSAMTNPETEAHGPPTWGWVETGVWTERMLAALGNGVKGGKWFSLMDKVYSPRTLAVAWERVAANKGAAGMYWTSSRRFSTRTFWKRPSAGPQRREPRKARC